MDWTQVIILPTANGDFLLKWFPVEDRQQQKLFDHLEDILEFLKLNF